MNKGRAGYIQKATKESQGKSKARNHSMLTGKDNATAGNNGAQNRAVSLGRTNIALQSNN